MNPPTTPEPGTPAALWLRLAAAGYDLFPLAALLLVGAGLALLITRGALDPHSMLYRVWLLAIAAAYFVHSWMRGGQTIGMRPWRLKLVRSDGGALALPQALLRFVVACISLAVFGLGFAWALVDARRRTWHDIVAGSELRRLPRT